MKKMITLLLVLTGMVCTASAAKLYVNTSTNASWWTNVRIYAYNSESDNNGWNYSESGVVSSTETLFGKTWYVFDMGSYSNAIVQYFESSDHSISNQSSDVTDITNDRFIFIPGSQTEGKWVWYENGYTFRSNVLDNWNVTTCNMTVVDNNTLSYTLTKSDIASSSVDKIWFRILNQEGQLYPQADGSTLTYGVGTSTYYNNWDGTSWSFGIEIPSFDYEKIVVTASLSDATWTIKADVYISKTITAANEYATLGCSVPLDITSLPTGVTAYTVTADASTKKISKAEKTTALAANEGVLLQNASGKDVTLSIPVAAEASASASNGMVAFTGSGNLTQPGSDYTYYILANQNDHVGFYKVNTTSGNGMGANTAYLRVNGTVAARDFYWFDDEATGITSTAMQPGIGQYYDLQGRRVAQPAKGLYIVNGKKIVIR